MLTVCIQAGGRSSRMGQEKGLIPLRGRPLIEWVLDALHDLGDELMITTNHVEHYSYLGLKMVSDDYPGHGALVGLSTALSGAEGDQVLVVASDMPFLNRQLIDYMVDLQLEADVVVPVWRGMYEPLHAIYSQRCLSKIQTTLAAGRCKLTDIYSGMRMREVTTAEIRNIDPQGLSFFNINTPADLETAEEILEQNGDSIADSITADDGPDSEPNC